jgi:hypothetical protein
MGTALRGFLLLVGALAACSEVPPRPIETHILCVWEGAQFAGQGLMLGDIDMTPNLSAWRTEGHLDLAPESGSPSRSAAFAELLTGVSIEQHGLRSAHELGASQLHGALQTRAEALPSGTATLASVSRGHFAWQGLGRGIEHWYGPAFSKRRAVRDGQAVWQAVEGPLDLALATDAPVFLVLQFSDLLDSRRLDCEPTPEQLASAMKAWRGKGGVIDEQFALQGATDSLASRLSKQLMRRTSDPRRLALEEAYQAASIGQLDGILGELRALLKDHRRLDAARLELSFGGNPQLEFPLGQELQLSTGEGFEPLQLSVQRPNADPQILSPGTRFGFSARGAEFIVRLKHPQMFYLGMDDLVLGTTSLGDSDVPTLLAGQSKPWPKHSLTGPLLDFNKHGGRRLRGKVQASAEVEVELQVTHFPHEPGWMAAIESGEARLEAHPLQPGVAILRAKGSFEFLLPPSAASSRLGVVLRLNGERVSASRMRYLGRSFVATNALDLCFSSASWLTDSFRAAPSSGTNSAIHLQLIDSMALLPALVLPSPEELALLRGLAQDD